MSDIPKRRAGRPRLRPESEAPSSYVGFKTDDELKSKLVAAGARADRSLSAETRFRVETTFMQEEMLAEALRLSYGGEGGALVILFGELLRSLTPKGRWLEPSPAGAAARRELVRGLDRVMARLAYEVTDPGLFNIRAVDVEGEVDQMLFDLGRVDASGDPGKLTYRVHPAAEGGLVTHVLRWAEETRRRLGPLGPLLIEMHRARREQAWSPAVVHGADSLNLLQAALEQVRTMLESTKAEAAAIEAQSGEPPRNKLARLAEVEATLTKLMLAGAPGDAAAPHPSPGEEGRDG